ncbi:MAG: hypothetical protein Q4D29_10145 [Lachnospiraceae bacterium]|nr:hypothetical protein [Lachnospiraceae bacterium]
MEFEMDQVRVTYGNYGNDIEKIELLLLPDTMFVLELEEENVKVSALSENDEELFSGNMTKETMECFARYLIKMKKQMNK